MADIIACPHCKGALLAPATTDPASELACPLCESPFAPHQASPAHLPAARVVPPKVEEPVVAPAPPAEPAPVEPSPAAARKPPAAGSLSEWLDKAEDTTVEFESPPESSEFFSPAPSEPAVEEPTPAAAADETKQPSLESLLSSFRGEQPAAPALESEHATDASRQAPVEPIATGGENKATLSSFATLSDFAPLGAQAEAATSDVDQLPSDAPPEPLEPVRVTSPAAEKPLTEFEFDLPAAPSQEAQPEEAVPQEALTGQRVMPRGAPIKQDLRQKPRREPSRRWLQPAAVAASGLMGVGLGYLGLLWLAGPPSDLLGASQWLPNAVLPASFAAAEPLNEPTQSEPAGEQPSGSSSETIERAAFEAPLASPPKNPSMTAEDPLEEPDLLAGLNPYAKPLGGEVTPAGAPGPFPLSRLEQLLPGAEQARHAMSESSLAANPESARELGAAFAQLCQLAEALTFAEQSPTDDGLILLEAKEVFQRLFQYEHARDDARGMAVRWIHWSDRAHGGVFLAGNLVAGEQRGSVYEYQLDIGDKDPLVVLSSDPIRVSRFLKAKSMGVVGCLIDSPAERLPGYTGQASRAVWAGHTISLGEPKFD